jgi:hypothetical protein
VSGLVSKLWDKIAGPNEKTRDLKAQVDEAIRLASAQQKAASSRVLSSTPSSRALPSLPGSAGGGDGGDGGTVGGENPALKKLRAGGASTRLLPGAATPAAAPASAAAAAAERADTLGRVAKTASSAELLSSAGGRCFMLMPKFATALEPVPHLSPAG